MIADAVARALGQLGDPRFRRVLLLGIGLTLALLFAATVAFVWLVGWFVPESFSLPWIGEITWVDDALSWAVVPLMLVLSVFLMVPVASAFTGIFLDDVTDAVEARHYPDLAPAPAVPFATSLRDSAAFLGVIVAANLAALIPYLLLAPLAPVIFLALNGYLLGREYFQLIAMRRLGRAGASESRRRNAGTIWLAGAVMALPLAIPLVNLLVPVIGAAAFTHLYHRLEGRRA
jgi:CysZ protein